MALVGDLIISARLICPDLPQNIGVPAAPTLSASTNGGSLTTATYYVQLTALTAWGETSAGAEANAAVTGPTGSIAVTATAVPGATKYRAYYGTASGAENQYVESTTTSLSITTVGTAGTPPVQNSAWLPDTDGSYVSVFTMYQWLNDALRLAARITGGIADSTGLAANTNQPIYALTNQWLKITNGWYEGYPLELQGKGDTFQRTRTTATAGGGFSQFKQNDVNYIEMYPIPGSNADSTTLNGGITSSATSLTLASVAGFLDHGLIQIDNEIIFYGAISGLSLVGCVRGLGGTTPAAHSNTATVNELNLRLDGYRMPELYTVGSANNTITVPPTWETLLGEYMISRFREAEQDYQTAETMRKRFEQEMGAWARTNRPLAGPRQLGGSMRRTESYGGTMGGGWIIP